MNRERFPSDDEQREQFNSLSDMRGFGSLKHTMKQIRLGEVVNVEGFGMMTLRLEEGRPVLRK